MSLKDELVHMQNAYRHHPLRNIGLKLPPWLVGKNNILTLLYKEKKHLLPKAGVCYGHIVQANEILFGWFPHRDCPAAILYSTDPCVEDNPYILRELADELFSYKNKPLEEVPEQWRTVAQAITDEYARPDISFSLEIGGRTVTFRFMAIMVYRKLLPGRVLRGNLLPLLTAPDCRSVMILPKKYWSDSFTQVWLDHLI